jgi:hypothetical protein
MQVNALVVAAVISFSVGVSAIFLGALLFFAMTGEVNRKREDGNQVSYFDLRPFGRMEVYSEYRRLYPEGRLHLYLFCALGLTLLGFAGAFFFLCVMGRMSPEPPSRIGVG